MKKNIFMLMLLSIFILIAPANAVTLTQKLGNGYIKQNVNEGKNVTLSFSNSSYYTFQNWDVESSNVSVDTSSSNVSFSMPNEDVTIRANYDADIPEGGTGGVVGGGGGGGTSTSQYLITYDANGGSGSMADQTVLIGMSVTLNTNTFTNGLYVFKGWSIVKGGNVVYKDGESIVPASNMSLYAVWREYNPGTLKKDWYILGSKTNITTIEFVDEYVVTGNETNTWVADTEGKINCYVVGTKLFISGNGSGEILASTDQSGLFSGFTALTSVTGLDLFNTSNTTNLSNMFYNCSSMYSIDISALDTSSVANISNIFYGCSALKQVTIGSTNAVTNMSGMYRGCSALTTLDLSSLTTSNVTDMSYMFYGCSALQTLDISVFDTTKTTSKTSMFDNCIRLKLVTVGNKFSFGNDGGLPSPNSSYITGADGLWYPSTGGVGLDKDGYNGPRFPANVVATYNAVPSEVGSKTITLTYSIYDYSSRKEKYVGNDSSYTFKLATLSTYYKLAGWADSSSATSVQYNSGSTITLNANKTIYSIIEYNCSCCKLVMYGYRSSGICSTCSSVDHCSDCGKCKTHYSSSLNYCYECYTNYCDDCDCDCCDCCGEEYCDCSGVYYCDTCEGYYCDEDPCSCE